MRFVAFCTSQVCKKRQNASNTTISLVEMYRQYVREIIYRIENGALGNTKSGVVVCIDELDKITDDKELRDFIRNAKSVFDLEGVRYFLSISEDALASFNLGSISGKNEFDSSFDHVVRLKHLELKDAIKITKQYVVDKFRIALDEKATAIIGILSFGVPRDIIRKAESFFANNLTNSTATDLISMEIQEKLMAAYLSRKISADEMETILAMNCIQINELLMREIETMGIEKVKLLMFVYILKNVNDIVISSNVIMQDDKIMLTNYQLGYYIPTLSEYDVVHQAKLLQSVGQ